MKKIFIFFSALILLTGPVFAMDYNQNQKTAGTGGSASVSDTAYNEGTWNDVANVAPSKNAVRDKIEALDTAKANALGADDNYVTDAEKTALHAAGGDTALGVLGTKDTPIDADKVIQRNSASSDAVVTSTWTQIKAFLKTYFDGLYAAPNADTTGSAGSLKSPATTGKTTITGPGTGTTRAKTVRDADDTIIELGTTLGTGFTGTTIPDNSTTQAALQSLETSVELKQTAHAALTSIAGLTETAGGLFYGTADDVLAWLAAGATGKLLMGKGAAAPEWTPYTFPATVPTVGKVLISDGTNLIGSTALGTGAYATIANYLPLSTIVAAGDVLVGSGAGEVTVITKSTGDKIFGLSGGVLGYYGNFQQDDSADTFKSATPDRGTRRMVQSSISTGVYLYDTPLITGNVTWTNISQGAGTWTRVFEEALNVFTVLQEFGVGASVKNGATSAGFIDFYEDSDNGTNKAQLIGPASTADVVITLPAATDTLVGKATTDTLTNKTLTSPVINAGTGTSLALTGNLSGLLPSIIVTKPSGTSTDVPSETVLTHADDASAANAYVGMTLYNITDGVSGLVTASDSTTITVAAGSMSWANTNVYQLGPGPSQSGNMFYVGTAGTIRHPATAGYAAGYYVNVAGVVIVEMAADTMIFQGVLNSAFATLDAGDCIDSPATKGSYYIIHNKSATEAIGFGSANTWLDGGAS